MEHILKRFSGILQITPTFSRLLRIAPGDEHMPRIFSFVTAYTASMSGPLRRIPQRGCSSSHSDSKSTRSSTHNSCNSMHCDCNSLKSITNSPHVGFLAHIATATAHTETVTVRTKTETSHMCLFESAIQPFKKGEALFTRKGACP